MNLWKAGDICSCLICSCALFFFLLMFNSLLQSIAICSGRSGHQITLAITLPFCTPALTEHWWAFRFYWLHLGLFHRCGTILLQNSCSHFLNQSILMLCWRQVFIPNIYSCCCYSQLGWTGSDGDLQGERLIHKECVLEKHGLCMYMKLLAVVSEWGVERADRMVVFVFNLVPFCTIWNLSWRINFIKYFLNSW